MSRRVPVCVFAKPPVAGAVKTRLAPSLGEVGAARLALAFFLDTWATVQALPWARPVLAATTLDPSAFGLDAPEVWLQGEGDLGERMARVLARGVEEAGCALVLGADLPGLPASHLDAAWRALANHDVVLGPSEDGGFYVLGAKKLPAGALSGLPWSTSQTRARTEERFASLGLTVAHAPSWFDVDEPGDLEHLRRLLTDNPACAPRTRQAWRELVTSQAITGRSPAP